MHMKQLRQAVDSHAGARARPAPTARDMRGRVCFGHTFPLAPHQPGGSGRVTLRVLLTALVAAGPGRTLHTPSRDPGPVPSASSNAGGTEFDSPLGVQDLYHFATTSEVRRRRSSPRTLALMPWRPQARLPRHRAH